MLGLNFRSKLPVGLLPTAAILFLCVGWASTYTISKGLTERLPAADWLLWRYVLATGILVLMSPKALVRLPRASLLRGVFIGSFVYASMWAQTAALAHTDASISRAFPK